MADRRGDGTTRQQPFSSSGQERVFDGGGGSGGAGQQFGSDFDHGSSSSYMSLLGAGAGVNSTQLPWAVDDGSAAPPINLMPQFSMGNYAPSSSTPYQQSAAFASPFAGNLHPYQPYLHADPPPQWPPRSMPAPSSLPACNFAVLPAPFPHEQNMHMQLLRAAALGSGGGAAVTHAVAPPQAIIEQPAKDGYNWRKYGQKQLKDAESPRSYYKCTRDGCVVKKIVERSFDGCIKEITYKGRHSHPRPPEPRRGHRSGAEHVAATAAAEEVDADHEASDDDDLFQEDVDDGAGSVAAGQRVVKKHKIILQTRSEVDLLDDGYRWRKYGQKVVKGNPRPRSYYKCTAENCSVRKQIERASDDPDYVLTTYTGRHSHDPPGRATGGASADPPPSSTSMGGTAAAGGSSQQPSGGGGGGARLLMKQESRS